MTVRKWTLRWVAPEIGSGSMNRPNALVDGPHVRWHGEEVEVVPAEQLQGAVEALEAIVARGEFTTTDDGFAYARELRDIASDALLNLKRGQPAASPRTQQPNNEEETR